MKALHSVADGLDGLDLEKLTRSSLQPREFVNVRTCECIEFFALLPLASV